ncbi:MAG: SDR family NAD(P)-dependent oxidoreductase, partial [Pseudolabrys sp.]
MTTKHKHDNPILVTGAAGAVGGIGRGLTEFLLARGHKVRALVRREDERAEALRRLGAEVVTGDLTDLASMHHAIEGCRRIYFGMSVSRAYLEATINTAAVARHHGVECFREHVADDGHADEHQRDHQQPTAQAALAVRVGAVLVGTAGRHGAADSLPRGFLSSNRRPQRAGLR